MATTSPKSIRYKRNKEKNLYLTHRRVINIQENKRIKNKLQKQSENNIIATTSYLPIITLSININTQPKDTQWLNGLKKIIITIHMLPTRDPHQIKRYTKTKSKEMEKGISHKCKGEKKAQGTILTSDKTDLKQSL